MPSISSATRGRATTATCRRFNWIRSSQLALVTTYKVDLIIDYSTLIRNVRDAGSKVNLIYLVNDAQQETADDKLRMYREEERYNFTGLGIWKGDIVVEDETQRYVASVDVDMINRVSFEDVIS